MKREQARIQAELAAAVDRPDDEDDPLVQRLRKVRWPEPDAETVQRCLDDFHQRLDDRD